MQISNAIKNDVDTKKLREYGLMMAFVLVGIFGLAVPLLRNKPLAIWPFIVALLFASAAIIRPGVLSGVYNIWMKFGNVAGAINSRIVLGLVFFLLILPYGLVLRIFGRDTLNKSFSPTAKSYRESRAIPYSPKSMENPY